MKFFGYCLQTNNVGCLRSAGPFDDVKLYSLILVKGFIAFTLDRRVMNEYVSAFVLLNESIAFFGIKPFYFTFHLDCASFRTNSCKSGITSSTFRPYVKLEAVRSSSSSQLFHVTISIIHWTDKCKIVKMLSG